MASRSRKLSLLIITCFFHWQYRPTSSQTATIVQGQRLTHHEQLVSTSGIFRLGFKSVHKNNSYLGIWYYGEDDSLVWVANRNTPIFGASGILEVDDHGNLKIWHESDDALILYSVEKPSKTSATLEDSGNFVLYELNSNGSAKQVLWQSFDHPTDTLLPGMKLGFNSKASLNWSLTSWRSDMAPASGSFTLGLDPTDTSQLIMWWRGEIYWKSGSMLRYLRASSNNSYDFGYISTENETYFNYSVKKAVTIFPRLKLSSEGELVSSKVDSPQVTEVSCANNLISLGCSKQNIPKCSRSLGNSVFKHRVGFMSDAGFLFSDSDNLSRIDCKTECLNDCSCIAYASKNDDGTGCEIWRTGEISFTKSTTSRAGGPDFRRDVFILPHRENNWWIWLIIVLGGLMVVPPFLSMCYALWERNKRKELSMKMTQRMLLNEIGSGAKPSGNTGSREKDGHNNELIIFSFESIVAATNCFSGGNKLGAGGFGPVYKGKLVDGQQIAVKRLANHSGQGLVEFKNEAMLIAKLQHTNLVRLLGFCVQGEEKILVYEYMANKSLDFFIFGSDKKYMLNWKKRFNIIQGIAQGLIYLHKYSRLKVIHRDLKASNILLDDEMNPKISDFGMARIFGFNQSEANTKRVVGTYGYMSPEYAFHGIVSTKTDVFSFGVLLLEIVSGKKNNCSYHPDHPLNLIGYAWQLWNEGQGLMLIDPILNESYSQNEAMRCIHVGLLCVQDRAMDRPTMVDAVSMLSNENAQLSAPKQPAFFIFSDSREADIGEIKSNKCSINYLSVTVMEAR